MEQRFGRGGKGEFLLVEGSLLSARYVAGRRSALVIGFPNWWVFP
jgi:hypothetical protein